MASNTRVESHDSPPPMTLNKSIPATEFILFPRLPLELREQVWRLAIPFRDVKIGNHSTHEPAHAHTTVLVQGMLRACSESRRTALPHVFTRFVDNPVNHTGPADTATAQFDRVVKTAYLPRGIMSLLAYSNLFRCTANSVALLMHDPAKVREVYMWVTKRKPFHRLHLIQTVYAVLSGVVAPAPAGGIGTDTRPWPPYDGSDICVLPLDDACLPSFLGASLERQLEKDARCIAYHRSVSCFLDRLSAYWASDPRIKELKARHEAVVRKYNPARPGYRPRAPRLVPAVMFGKTTEALRGEDSELPLLLLHQRQAGLIFKSTDVPMLESSHDDIDDATWKEWLLLASSPYDCQSLCTLPGGVFP